MSGPPTFRDALKAVLDVRGYFEAGSFLKRFSNQFGPDVCVLPAPRGG